MDAFVCACVYTCVCVHVVYVGLSVLKGGVGWGGVKRHAHLFSFPQFYECNYSEKKIPSGSWKSILANLLFNYPIKIS